MKKAIAEDFDLLVPEKEVHSAKVQCYCCPQKCLPLLRKNVNVFQKFKSTVFGKFAALEEIQWHHPTVHALMSRKVNGKGIDLLEGAGFLIKDDILQFTIKDFALITGLRCGKLPELKGGESTLKQKYFKDIGKVTIKDLEKAVRNCSDVEDQFRLGLVLFAEVVLFGREPTGKIELNYLKLVENIEEWNEYPWGTASWACTNDSIQRALDPAYLKKKEKKADEKSYVATKGNNKEMKKNTSKGGVKKNNAKEKQVEEESEGNEKPQYKLRGFAYAFQAWAYELFPAFRRKELVQLERKVGQPRLFHWDQKRSDSFVTLYQQVFSSSVVTVEPMRPTEEELKEPYWSWGNIEEVEEPTSVEGTRDMPDLEIPATNNIRELQTLVTNVVNTLNVLIPENNMLKRKVSALELDLANNVVQLEDVKNRLAAMEGAADEPIGRSATPSTEQPNERYIKHSNVAEIP